MSLTSYRAAPPRGEGWLWVVRSPVLLVLFVLAAEAAAGKRGLLHGSLVLLPWASDLLLDRPACGSAQVVLPGIWDERFAFDRPGSDRLSRVLGHSIMGAGAFHGRVRNGIGCLALRQNHQVGGRQSFCEKLVCFRARGWIIASSGGPGSISFRKRDCASALVRRAVRRPARWQSGDAAVRTKEMIILVR